jgi:hypothetical protein
MVADLLIHSGRWIRFFRDISGMKTFYGKITQGAPFAEWRKKILGRFFSQDPAQALTWVERPHLQTHLIGGSIASDGKVWRVVPMALEAHSAIRSRLWLGTEAARTNAVRSFVIQHQGNAAEALKRAKSMSGFEQEVHLGIGDRSTDGDTEANWYFLGKPAADTNVLEVALISRVHPVFYAALNFFLLLGISTLIFACAVAITVAGLTQPYFEGVSLAGGVAGLTFFLLVQAIAVWARGFALQPGEKTARFETSLEGVLTQGQA